MRLLIFCSCVAVVFSYSLKDQRRALEKIFDSTNGNGWKRKDNWKADTNPCEKDKVWFGIQCSGDIVISLVLEKNGLGGVNFTSTLKKLFFSSYYQKKLVN